MKTKRNWVQVAVVVVMAVARLSFTTPVAADLCGVPFVSEFDQYRAATEWAEKGGPVPEALTVSCVEDSTNLTASLADLSGDGGVRWEQYMAAIEGTTIELALSASSVAGAPLEMFEQYQAAVEEHSEQYLTGTDRAPSASRVAEESFGPYWEQVFGWTEASESALNTRELTWARFGPRQVAIEGNYWDQIFDWTDGSR